MPQTFAGRRVLMIVENLPVPFDRRAWQEARALTRHGAEVTVICPAMKGYEARHEELEGVRILRHPMPFEARGGAGYLVEYAVALFWETALAWRAWFRWGFDAIHLCNPPDLLFLVAAPFRLLGKRVLFDHHDINPELYEAKFGKRGLPWRALVLAERLTFMACHVSIATNESYRRIAVERGRMPPEHVHVVRSGPDLSRLKREAPVAERRRGRSILIGYVGVIGQQEGIDHLLQALVTLRDELGFDDFHCTICGSGPALEDMRALATRLGLDGRVDFPGRVSDRELLEILNTADVCVNPDVWNPMNDKSTMNKIMEYMALGKPIVQYDLTEGRYSAGDASLYASPNDPRDFARCILDLVRDPGLRQRMGELGRRRVEESLSWESEEPRLVAAYRDLFEDRRD